MHSTENEHYIKLQQQHSLPHQHSSDHTPAMQLHKFGTTKETNMAESTTAMVSCNNSGQVIMKRDASTSTAIPRVKVLMTGASSVPPSTESLNNEKQMNVVGGGERNVLPTNHNISEVNIQHQDHPHNPLLEYSQNSRFLFKKSIIKLLHNGV